MEDISLEEKIELLENWKNTLLGDVETYQEEVQAVLERKDKAQQTFNRKMKKSAKDLELAQNRVDKSKIQLEKVIQEIKKLHVE